MPRYLLSNFKQRKHYLDILTHLYHRPIAITSPRILMRKMSASTNPTTPTSPSVLHDANKNTFYIELLPDGGDVPQRAVLDYAWTKDGVLDLYHTEVPPVFRGKGVAKLLAKAALDYGVEKDAKMKLTCTYLQKYVNDNPLSEYTSRAVGHL